MPVPPAVLLLGAVLLTLPPASGQAQPTRPLPPASQEALAAHFGGHTTTFRIEKGELGPVHLTLALLPTGNGWLYSEAGPGGGLTPRLLYIYRWWRAQDGTLCYLYSPPPNRMTDRSRWTCWATGMSADGVPVLLDRTGAVLPVLARVRGNALESHAQAFLEAAARHNGGVIPAPQDPIRPPPP